MHIKRKNILRGVYYITGLFLLVLGVVLSTKADLGVSPIISIPYSLSKINGFSLGDMTLLLYTIFVLTQMLLHSFTEKERRRINLFKDIMQLVISLIFTRAINLFDSWIPDLCVWKEGKTVSIFLIQIAVLCTAIILVGVGTAWSLDANVIPNPADGFVNTLAQILHKSVGICKNFVDISCVLLTIVLCKLYIGHVVGIGVGTIIAMICVGRVVAFFNTFLWPHLEKLSKG